MAEVADRFAAWKAAGASRFSLQILDLADLEHLSLIAGRLGPLID
jgi:hypothetical protein